MKFERTLFISAGILLATGFSSENGFSAETDTASNVLSNLLTTTAGAIAQNQQAQPAQPVGTTAQAAPEVQPANNQQVSNQQAKPVDDNGESVLPNFDDLVNDTPKVDTPPATVGSTATNSEKLQITTTPRTEVTPQTSSQNILSATSQTGNLPPSSTTPPSAEAKKVGFVDINGNILVAPSDMIFPAEMQDGEMYIFSKDIEALKKKLSANGQSLSQMFPQMRTGNYQSNPTQATPGQAIAGQVTPEGQMAPNQTVPGQYQTAPWINNNKSWQYNPQDATNAGMPPQYPRQSQLDNFPQGNTPQTNSFQQGNSQWKYPQNGMQGMPARDQNGNVISPSNNQSGASKTSGMTGNGYTAQILEQGMDTTISTRDPNKKPIMFQCYLA